MICDVCEVDHATSSADLSCGLVYLLAHDTELYPWAEWPISGDAVALQRAGELPPALIWSTDWEQLGDTSIRDMGDDDPMRRPGH